MTKYKNYDDWFKHNCKGCSVLFECQKWWTLDKTSVPFKCDTRVPEAVVR